MQQTLLIENRTGLYSKHLNRKVDLTVLVPVKQNALKPMPLLLMNDGQDFGALGLKNTVEVFLHENQMEPVLIVGIHANQNRLAEYGTACTPDYANRGSKAPNTTSFVIEELVPYLNLNYNVHPTGITYCGFSLGGLMALDIAWNHPRLFSKVGVFSGSLWWRSKALDDGYKAEDRIMHQQIASSIKRNNMQFWFQCGTQDETDDRDNDGVIDSIQDTLDCIAELEQKGYGWGKEVFYKEVKEGRHNPDTWSKVMPEFLRWAYGATEEF